MLPFLYVPPRYTKQVICMDYMNEETVAICEREGVDCGLRRVSHSLTNAQLPLRMRQTKRQLINYMQSKTIDENKLNISAPETRRVRGRESEINLSVESSLQRTMVWFWLIGFMGSIGKFSRNSELKFMVNSIDPLNISSITVHY